MPTRVDSASRLIAASREYVYRAFAEPGAMEQWMPPRDMTGAMLHFDFREGGSYRMRLTYAEPHTGRGKTSADADEVEVRLTKLEYGRTIEQEIIFDTEASEFSGTMRVIWTLQSEGNGTRVTVRAENVPEGIRPEDHEAGLESTLANLEEFVAAAS